MSNIDALQVTQIICPSCWGNAFFRLLVSSVLSKFIIPTPDIHLCLRIYLMRFKENL